MDPPGNPTSNSANADSRNGMIQVKQLLDVVLDQSPTASVTNKAIVRNGIKNFPADQRDQLYAGIEKQKPKFKALIRANNARNFNSTGTAKRDRYIEYLDEQWDDRRNWSRPDLLCVPLGDKPSYKTIRPLKILTDLALEHDIPLRTLSQRGGALFDTICTGKRILSKEAAAATLDLFRRPMPTSPRDASESRSTGPLPSNPNPDFADAPEPLSTPPHENGSPAPSPKPEQSRNEYSEKDAIGTLSSPYNEIECHLPSSPGHLELDDTVDAVRTPLASSPVIDLTVNHTSPEDKDQDAETLAKHNKAAWDATRTQLQDPKAPLTDEVLTFLLKVVHQTSDAPGATVMDPSWLNLEDDHIPVDLHRIWESTSTVYVPLHHVEGKNKHWSLLEFQPHRKEILEFRSDSKEIWHHDSMHSYDRDTRIKTSLARKLGESRPFRLSPYDAPQQPNGTSCGVYVATFLNFLLNDEPMPYSLDETIRFWFLEKLEQAGIDPCSPRPNRYNRNKPIVRRSQDSPFTLEDNFGTSSPKSSATSSPSTDKLADIDIKQPKSTWGAKNLGKSDPIGFVSPFKADFYQYIWQDTREASSRQTTPKQNTHGDNNPLQTDTAGDELTSTQLFAQMDTWSRSNGGIDLSTAIAETEQLLQERQTQADKAVKRRRLFETLGPVSETLQRVDQATEEIGLIPFGEEGSIWSSKVEEDAWILQLEAMSNLVQVQSQRFSVDTTEQDMQDEITPIEAKLRKMKEHNKNAKAARLMQEAWKVMHEPES
ncbi:sentrin sumo-specific [Fusarium flagelliforme]|uniref:Sentrin sumo-specific n=1 Tax=Fusarium flagelliforme TaxID=2675880 RepID=A0A395MBM9_9HYPO|nr:sentrin sumo-specific [Fusarium flagelliforme]